MVRHRIIGESLLEVVFDRMRDIAEVADLTRPTVVETLIETMSIPEPGVRPEHYMGATPGSGERFGCLDEPSR